MEENIKVLPEIVLIKSDCTEYGTCWHAAPPYYTGHHRTRAMAAVAATNLKRKMREEIHAAKRT